MQVKFIRATDAACLGITFYKGCIAIQVPFYEILIVTEAWVLDVQGKMQSDFGNAVLETFGAADDLGALAEEEEDA